MQGEIDEYRGDQGIFGALISAIFIYFSLHNPHGYKTGNMIVFVINAFLYPYSRFVYETIVGFIMGQNVFFVNALLMLMALSRSRFVNAAFQLWCGRNRCKPGPAAQ